MNEKIEHLWTVATANDEFPNVAALVAWKNFPGGVGSVGQTGPSFVSVFLI